jgi:hypothetical protein
LYTLTTTWLLFSWPPGTLWLTHGSGGSGAIGLRMLVYPHHAPYKSTPNKIRSVIGVRTTRKIRPINVELLYLRSGPDA